MANRRAPDALALGGLLAFALVVDLFLDRAISDSSLRGLMMLALCNVVVALSLNIINGMAGQFSIGHAGFVAVGAYASAITASSLHVRLGSGAESVNLTNSLWVVPLCLLVSAAVAATAGLIVGLPSLRLKGDYLAIVTLGFAEIVRLSIATASLSENETQASAWAQVGSKGLVGPFFHALGVSLSALGGQNGYDGASHNGVPAFAGPFWIISVTGVLFVVAYRIKFSGWGRALRALREDEIAAASVGVDPTRYKVASFVLSSAGAGIAGGMLALMRDGNPTVQPESFNFQTSFDAITMVILGGSGSVSGAALGALFVTLSIKAIEYVQGTSLIVSLKQSAAWLDLNALRMMLYAAVLIALMILRPEGVLGERELFQKKLKRDAQAKATSKAKDSNLPSTESKS
jgi:branched-chain amino acid transport system permease protein